MATGVGMGFDVSQLTKAMDKLDKQLEAVLAKSDKVQKSFKSLFDSKNPNWDVLTKIDKLKSSLVDISKVKDPLKWDTKGVSNYIDQVNRLLRTINVMNSAAGYQFFDTKDLEKAKTEFKKLLTEVKGYEKQSAARTTSRNQTYSGALRYSANVKNLEQERQAVINLEAARDKLKKSDADYATKLNTLNLAIQKHEQNLRNATKTDQQRAEEARKASEKIVEAQRKERAEYERRKTSTMDKWYSSSSSRALKFSTNTKTLEEEARAVKYLEAARAKLNTQDANYKKNLATLNAEIKRHKHNLDEAKKGAQELKNQHKGLLDTSGQLARAMAAVFSVSAIKGYVNKLIQIRGEFEMQQRSLQVLLQNKAEANELWDKTVSLAVKSPLTTKQLVTSTKQLAAYRVETEKLYETNKMLADVSQGLGVDMNRLILAFGQVKAASFLRGTELRQFSEAGVNMLSELANHFEKLEGRAVSVGEVFERVSKRMVTFEDVEAVFKNITSKGGTFYQMQEKQSKTLRGMMLNLKDSYELMLNDIGEEQEGLLKGFINLMRELVRSWREFAPLIKTAGLTFLAYFSFSKIAQLVTWFNNLAVAIKGVGAASAMATKINPWVALATVITAVAVAAYELSTAVSEFEAISVSVNKEVTEIFSEQVALYKELADKYNDATTSEEERKEVLGELQQKYKEILPDMYTELEYIEAHAGHYQAAEEAMRSYYNSMAIERKKSKIMASHEESLYQTDIPELAEQWRQEISDMSNLSKLEKAKLNAVMPNIITEAVEAYISGAENDWEKGISDRATKYIGKEISRNAFKEHGTYQGSFDEFNLFNHQMADMHFELLSLKRELGSVSGLAFRTMDDELDNAEIEAIKKRIKEVEEAYKALSGIYKQLSQGKLETKDVEEKVKAPMNVLVDAFGEEDAKSIEANLKNISNSVYDFTVGLNGVTVGFYNQLAAFAKTRPSLAKSLLDRMGLSVGENPLVDVLSQNLKDTEKEYGNIQKEVLNVFEEVRDKFNLSSEDMDVFAVLFPDDSKTLSDVRTNLSGKIEQLTGDIKLYKKAIESGNPNENPLGFKDEDVKKWEQQIKWLQLALDMLGGDSKKNEKGDEQLKILNRRISLVKEMYNEYVKLHERFNAYDAEKKVESAYKDTFKDAFEGTGINFSGLVINKERLTWVQQEGAMTGIVFSESMLQKMEEVLNAGTYIRNASDAFKEQLKGDEGLMLQLYDDSTKNIIKNAEDFKNSVGTVTIGFGHAITKLEEAEKYFGKTLTEQEATEIFDIDVSKHVDALNTVLDKHRELILTQEQYDALLNATYQGGAGMVRSAIEYATNEDSALAHFALLDEKLKKVGLTFEQEFGADFVDRFKNAENASERLALALETVGLTTKASGSNIDKNLYNGMKRRSADRAAAFRGDLELVELLYNAAVDVSQIDFTNVAGVVDILKQLVPIAEKEGKEAELALSKEISKWEAEIKLDAKIREDKRFDEDIQRLFGNYELSLELEKLNIPKDLASRLFGIDSIDLTSLRKEILDRAGLGDMENQANKDILKSKAYENLEKHRRDELANSLQKVEKMEREHQEKLLKQYSKYLVQAQSERIKIKLDELRQLKEIESLEIGDADKELMRQGVQKDIQKRLDTQAWKDFQESGMYVRLFDNLEGASMQSLDKMENALMVLRESLKDLDPSELKEINNQLEKIRDIKVDKNPFKGLADDAKMYFEYVKNRKDWEASLDASEAKEADLRSKADEKSLYIKSLEDEIDLIDQSTIEGENLAIAIADKIELEKENLKVLLDELEAQGKITKEERARIEKGQDAGKSIQDRLSKTAQQISAVTSSMADMATNLEAAFGMSDSLKDTFELLQGIGGGVSDMFSGAAGVISGDPLKMIQGGMQLIGGFSKIIGSFNDAYDNKRERQIQREIKLVERLGKLYDKLEESINNAYTFDTFQAANNAAKDNLEEQIRARERMIEAEYDKKETDYGRIEQWREEIEEALEQIKELESSRLQELGGIGGEDYYKDAAQSFVDAWLDAFYETGDGLTALEDEFDEVMKNLVKKQVLQRVAGALIEPLLASVDAAVANDGLFDEKEFANVMELAKQMFPEFNEKMKETIDAMGMTDWAGKNAELGSLAAGIQGVSEETANVISSYLNSIRFFVADSNTQLKALVAAQGIDTDAPNPMLSQLLVIAEQTRAIRDMFESVIGRGGNNKHGGAYLKVDIG